MNRITWRAGLSIVVAIVLPVCASASLAQEGKTAKSELPPVAATVDDDAIYVGEVEAKLTAAARRRQSNPQGLDHARAAALRDLVTRLLVLRALEHEGGYIDNADVDKAMHRLEDTLKDKNTTLAQYAIKRGVGPEVARREFAFNFGWPKYLERNLADALEGYFDDHHKELDGTEVRVSHILLRSQRAGEPAAQIAARAEKIRDEITSGKITFEQAAEKYSAGPSRRQGGDLGFIPRYGVMVDGFAKAAFALEDGEISKPVLTAFGTHLIRVTGVKPGKKQWTEVVPQTRDLAAVELFEKLANGERETAKIEFTGKSPYFKDGTDEVVSPAGVAQK